MHTTSSRIQNRKKPVQINGFDQAIRTLQGDRRIQCKRQMKSKYPTISLSSEEVTGIIKFLEKEQSQDQKNFTSKGLLRAIHYCEGESKFFKEKSKSEMEQSIFKFYQKYSGQVINVCQNEKERKQNFWLKLDKFIQMNQRYYKKIPNMIDKLRRGQIHLYKKFKDENQFLKDRFCKEIMEPLEQDYSVLALFQKIYRNLFGINFHSGGFNQIRKLEQATKQLEQKIQEYCIKFGSLIGIKKESEKISLQTLFSNIDKFEAMKEKQSKKQKDSKIKGSQESIKETEKVEKGKNRTELNKIKEENRDLKETITHQKEAIEQKNLVAFSLAKEKSDLQSKVSFLEKQLQNQKKLNKEDFDERKTKDSINNESIQLQQFPKKPKIELKNQKYQLQNKIRKFQEQYLEKERTLNQQYTEEKSKLMAKITNLEEGMKQKTESLHSSKSKIEEFEKIVESERKQIERIKTFCEQQKLEKAKSLKFMEEKLSSQNTLNKKWKEQTGKKHEQEMEQLRNQNKKERQQHEKIVESLKKSERQKMKQIQASKLKIKQGQNQKKKTEESLKQQSDRWKKEMEKVNSKNMEHEQKQKQLEEQKKSLSQELKLQNVQNQAMEKKYENITDNLEEKMSEVKNLKEKIRSDENKIKEKEEIEKELRKEIQRNKEENERVGEQFRSSVVRSEFLVGNINELTEQNERFRSQLIQLQQNSSKHLFNGDCFEDKEEEKLFLIENIENNTKKIRKTKFLYSFPTLSKLNFHELIDGKENYVLVIRLLNDRLLVGYSQQELCSDVENTKDGFIASLTNKEAFRLKKNNPKAKVAAYNEYFFIFGNAEIRIKAGSNVVESNFGTAFKYFNTGSYKDPEVLFGTPERQVQMKCYEVFQVFFE